MKAVLTIRLLLIAIAILLAIIIEQSIETVDLFHCVSLVSIGVCYWVHGK